MNPITEPDHVSLPGNLEEPDMRVRHEIDPGKTLMRGIASDQKQYRSFQKFTTTIPKTPSPDAVT